VSWIPAFAGMTNRVSANYETLNLEGWFDEHRLRVAIRSGHGPGFVFRPGLHRPESRYAKHHRTQLLFPPARHAGDAKSQSRRTIRNGEPHDPAPLIKASP